MFRQAAADLGDIAESDLLRGCPGQAMIRRSSSRTSCSSPGGVQAIDSLPTRMRPALMTTFCWLSTWARRCGRYPRVLIFVARDFHLHLLLAGAGQG